MSARLWAVAGAALVLGCGHGAAPSQATESVRAPLAPGLAALVGQATVPVSLVAEVARAQRIPPRVARDRLVADALAAEGARASGDDRESSTSWALEATVARAVVDRVRIASTAGGPPTDAEVAELTRRDWRDVDLPEQVKVIHALVRRPKDPALDDAARALAAQLATTLAGASTEDQFDTLAHSVPSGPLEVIVERLPPFVPDGRTSEGAPNVFDPPFARAAFGLRKPGETTGVVESSFGWHVIRLIERRPPKTLPLEERRVRFAEQIYARRGRDDLERVLTARRSATRVEISPGAEALMATVPASPPP